MDRRPEQTFFKRRHIGGQQTHEKMLNIANCQGSANQNNKIAPHRCQSGYYQSSTNNKCWKRCGEKRTLVHCLWECKLVQPPWKTVWRFLKRTKKQIYHMIQHFHCCRYIWEKNKNTNLKRYICPNVCSSIIYNCQDMEATQRPIDRRMDKDMIDRQTDKDGILLSHKNIEILPFAAT